MLFCCSRITSYVLFQFFFFFSSRRRHTRCSRDWSSDVCSSDLWMDEGFNSFTNIYSGLAFYHDTIPTGRGAGAQWAKFAATGLDEPPILAADRVAPRLLEIGRAHV